MEVENLDMQESKVLSHRKTSILKLFSTSIIIFSLFLCSYIIIDFPHYAIGDPSIIFEIFIVEDLKVLALEIFSLCLLLAFLSGLIIGYPFLKVVFRGGRIQISVLRFNLSTCADIFIYIGLSCFVILPILKILIVSPIESIYMSTRTIIYSLWYWSILGFFTGYILIKLVFISILYIKVDMKGKILNYQEIKNQKVLIYLT